MLVLKECSICGLYSGTHLSKYSQFFGKRCLDKAEYLNEVCHFSNTFSRKKRGQ
jgi:hypothetical protein